MSTMENQKEKIKCICSHYISQKGMEAHLKSKYHNDRITSKKRITPTPEKIELYNQNKDNYNCCSKCYRTKIPDLYFIKDLNICKCCHILSLDSDKLCKHCNTTKNINLFERPYLNRCKQCAATRAKTRVTCELCNKICDFGTFSKHKKTHL